MVDKHNSEKLEVSSSKVAVKKTRVSDNTTSRKKKKNNKQK